MEISIQSKHGYEIKSNFFVNGDIKKIYIFLHGLGGDKLRPTVQKIIESLSQIGINAVTFDFIGHGESKVDFKDFSIQKCVDDLEDVISFVKAMYPNAKIGLFGTSLGGHVALQKLFKNDCHFDSVILKSPAINICGAVDNLKPYFNVSKRKINFTLPLLKDFNFNKNIIDDLFLSSQNLMNEKQKINCPILVIQGQKDDIAPCEITVNFAEKHFKNCKIKLFKDADHNFANEGEVETICKNVKTFENNL